MNTVLEEHYEVDILGTLEEALLCDLSPYNAIVFDMRLKRGNIIRLEDFGLYSIPLLNDPTGSELFPGLDQDNYLSDMRISDIVNGWAFAWLARIPKKYRGLEYRGGLMTLTDMHWSEVKAMFNEIGYDVKTHDEKILFPQDILYVNSFPKDASQMIADIRRAVSRVANIHFPGPLNGEYIAGSNFSSN